MLPSCYLSGCLSPELNHSCDVSWWFYSPLTQAKVLSTTRFNHQDLRPPPVNEIDCRLSELSVHSFSHAVYSREYDV